MLDRSVRWFWSQVDSSVAGNDRSLDALRWLVGFYLVLIEAPYYSWIGDAPRAFFDPPVFSIASVAGGFPPGPFFVLLDLIAIGAIVLMTVGVRTRTATVVVVICRVVGSSFMFSFGKIDHTIMLTVFLAAMAYCDWGRRSSRPQSWDAPDRHTTLRSRQARALVAVALSFGFVTAGLPKLLHWVDADMSTSGFLSWYYEGLFDLRRNGMLAGWVPHLPPLLLELIDVAAVALELAGFVALLLGRIPWRVFLLLATTLHLANVLVLNIEFTAQAITYLAFAHLGSRRKATPGWIRFAAGCVLAIAVAWHVQARLRGAGSPIVFVSGSSAQLDAGLYAGLLICVAIIAILVREIGRERRSSTHLSARAEPPHVAPI